jgi:hypothetical protein
MYDRSKKMHGKNKNCTSAIQKLFAKFRPSTEATTYSAFLTDPYPISSFYGWLIDVDRFPCSKNSGSITHQLTRLFSMAQIGCLGSISFFF